MVQWVSGSRLVAFGASLVGLSVAFIPGLPGVLLLDLSQLIGGIGRGLVNTLAASLAISGVADAERATAMGVYQALWSVGILLGPPLAGWIAERHGLSAAFATGAVAAAIASGLALGLRSHQDF
jgi:MFS family permease